MIVSTDTPLEVRLSQLCMLLSVEVDVELTHVFSMTFFTLLNLDIQASRNTQP